jgi:hypothetical protein
MKELNIILQIPTDACRCQLTSSISSVDIQEYSKFLSWRKELLSGFPPYSPPEPAAYTREADFAFR